MIPVIELQADKKFIAIKDIPKMIADAIFPDAFPYTDFKFKDALFCTIIGFNEETQLSSIQKKHLKLQDKYQYTLEQLIKNNKLIPMNQDKYTDKYFYPNYNDLPEKSVKQTSSVDIRGDIIIKELIKQCNLLGCIVIINDDCLSSDELNEDFKRQKDLISQNKMAKKSEADAKAIIKTVHHDILRKAHFNELMDKGILTTGLLKKEMLFILRDDERNNKRAEKVLLWGRTGQSTFDKWLQTDDAKELVHILRCKKKNK